jgi:hypothetical protein
VRRAHQSKEPLITIEVTPLSGGYYAACLDDRVITKQTRTPLLTSARVLLSEGCDPATPIQMKHKGSDIVALKSTIGRAATLSVRETATAGPLFVRHAPPSLKGVAQDHRNVEARPWAPSAVGLGRAVLTRQAD